MYKRQIVNLPLADAQAIRFSSSLFLVPLAAIFLKEKIGIRRSLAAVVGFTGILIMLNPSADYNFASFMALGAAIAFAFAAILVNIVSKYDKPVTLMFYSNIVSVLIMIIPALIFWETPDFQQLILILFFLWSYKSILMKITQDTFKLVLIVYFQVKTEIMMNLRCQMLKIYMERVKL